MGLHICTNSPWIGEGLAPRAWPRHRVTLGHCQLEGWGSPFLVVCRSKREPLASAPIGYHVSRPYVKGGAVRGAGGAVAGRTPPRLAAGLAGERRQAALAVRCLGAAGIAGGASGMWGQVVLLLLVVCIFGSALLAAVILRGEWGGLPEGWLLPSGCTRHPCPCSPSALRRQLSDVGTKLNTRHRRSTSICSQPCQTSTFPPPSPYVLAINPRLWWRERDLRVMLRTGVGPLGAALL